MATALHWDHWTESDGPDQYTAESGDRSYIVREFSPAAHDGDPRLDMHDDRYRSQCWELIPLMGDNQRRGLLYDELGDALLAAQTIEDEAH
jgi:hypothetical protein